MKTRSAAGPGGKRPSPSALMRMWTAWILSALATAALPAMAQQQQEEIRKGKSALEIDRMTDSFWARQRKTPRIPPLRNASLREAIDDLKGGDSPKYTPLHVSYAEFITASGEYFVPLQLMISPGRQLQAGAGVTIFGIIDSLQGDELFTFEDRAALEPSGGDLIVSRSLFLRPGLYLGTVGLARGDAVIALGRVELSLLQVAEKSPGVSRLLLSSDVHPLHTAQSPTEPFAFGGIKVVPRGDHVFQRTDPLWAFVELRNPGVDQAGVPRVQMILEVEGPSGEESKRRAFPPTAVDPLELKGVPRHWGVGTTIDIQSLPAGDYLLHVLLVDTLRSARFGLVEPFRVSP